MLVKACEQDFRARPSLPNLSGRQVGAEHKDNQ